MSNENEEGLFNCRNMCWIIGALLAIATYMILTGRFDLGMIIALLLAVAVFLISAVFLRRLFCQGMEQAAQDSVPGSAPVSAPVSARHDHDIAASADAVAGVASNGAMSASLPRATPKVTSVDVAASAPTASKEPAAKATKKPIVEAVAKDGKPEMLTAARKGGADDLKLIKGVGPKLEAMLNKMGFYHFDQVAGWRAKEVKWVDENLQGFKGRVSRDAWVKQAKTLAKGGATEFSKKVKKAGVYAKKK